MTYVIGNPAMLGTFSMAMMLPMVVGLVFTPMLVKKFKGMYKVNLCGFGWYKFVTADCVYDEGVVYFQFR